MNYTKQARVLADRIWPALRSGDYPAALELSAQIHLAVQRAAIAAALRDHAENLSRAAEACGMTHRQACRIVSSTQELADARPHPLRKPLNNG